MNRTFTHLLTDWFFSDRRKPLVVRGARQVGKSFSVRHFAESHNLQLFEINLDRHLHLEAVFATKNVVKIMAEISGILGLEISSQNSLMFLDEIQATPSAIAALRYFYEEIPALAVVAAGSLLEFTLSDHEFSMPVGRVRYAHMVPMNFEEYLEAFDEQLALNRLRSFTLGEEFSANLHERIKDIEHLSRVDKSDAGRDLVVKGFSVRADLLLLLQGRWPDH